MLAGAAALLPQDATAAAAPGPAAPAPLAAAPAAAPAQPLLAPATVEVTGGQGHWQLTVDGAPFTVKGLTFGPQAAEAAGYLPDLARMGVNTLRTWGTDASSAPLLDAAAANGVRVIAGFWLQPGGGPGSGGCVDYVADTAYRQQQLAAVSQWVTAYRDHPGILMWDVGNESILGLQNCYAGQALEEQRAAYARFVDEAARLIHGLDPRHPVTSTDAWTGAWPYYRDYAPSLDLLAVNSYADVCAIRDAWTGGGYDRPYLLTEGGPPGEWETADDVTGVPAEPDDAQKSEGYRRAWRCLMAHEGVALGGTLFHYGVETDFGGVWFNLLPGGERRLSTYAVAELYGGSLPANTPPVAGGLAVRGDRTAVPAGAPLSFTASVTDPDGDPIAYEVRLSGYYLDGDTSLRPAEFTRAQDGTFTVTAPSRPGTWKLYLLARDGHGNVSYLPTSVNVVPPPVEGTNVARGRPTTASSQQPEYNGETFEPAHATDGDRATRWASDWSDPQWLQVDLGRVTELHHVQLIWEAAYARAYQVQVSDDGSGWRTVHEVGAGQGGVDTAEVTGSGRYVRVLATQRGTGYGYSLYEFGVYA
ncbi:discoidin domain-containing protein [Streptomyces hoynatensis]|uniref:beta-mannosidase n=1 Tax=Streptomyces hoynatensis TaxID=1141874 RepID=A0A3A9YL89_9ACTN|nr:hypothetical protein D7294_28795 [Streptomyces hoynatensis]